MQPIYDIAEICFRKNIDTVVISPGSRSAPLVLAFARHSGIEKHVVPDERCAAYMALGMAITTGRTVALVCTSGTAALNFAPAIAEAFYLEAPLLVLTADRPPEWVDQADGQTIRQQHIYGNHVKKFYQLPSDYGKDGTWHINRTVNEAINLSRNEKKGPVHINVPLREPLYPAADALITYSEVRIIEQARLCKQFSPEEWRRMKEEFNRAEKKLLVLGQHTYCPELAAELRLFIESTGIQLISDVTGNPHLLNNDFIRHQDLFLGKLGESVLSELKPDLLISTGGPLISKQLKNFFRKFQPLQHWHIAEGESCPDTFGCLTRHIPVTAQAFFRETNRTASGPDSDRNETFAALWKNHDRHTAIKIEEYLKAAPFSDFKVTHALLQHLPENSILHVGNSMPIRYVNFLGIRRPVEVHCNRGTSGIDGCLSTAIGAARKTEKTVTLLIGDLSFFYDSNGLFQQNLPDNLRIVVLNNGSGNIFRIIDGPSHLPESPQYFETVHNRSARFIAEGFGAAYFYADKTSDLNTTLREIYSQDRISVCEIMTNAETNTAVLKEFNLFSAADMRTN